MHKFTKESNGYTLTITLDENKLFEKLDEEIAEMQKLDEDHGKFVPNYLKIEYGMSQVYGDYECDFCTPKEIIDDLKEFKDIIMNIIKTKGQELWKNIVIKKDGTFALNRKPRLKEAINGSYWEDNYGWNTLVLRLVADSSTDMHVILDYVVLHY